LPPTDEDEPDRQPVAVSAIRLSGKVEVVSGEVVGSEPDERVLAAAGVAWAAAGVA
jgi:hypothetical protein